MTDYPPILSFGAGVNSTALAILAVNDGWRGEIVFADTGCEWPETYCFMDYFEREWLRPLGFEIVRLKGMPWQRQSDGHSLIEYCESAHVIPMAAVRWCTSEWKVRPLERYASGRETMVGIAADEAHRKPDAIRPLVDRSIDRKGCIDIIRRAGLDVPQKSGCYICPFQKADQWRELWHRHPELYARAEALEASAKRTKNGHYTASLDPSGKITLAQRRAAFESQLTLPEMDMDDLRAYQPCVCGL